MAARTRKKNSRLRGSKTHGYGSMKKHRGGGHRGGRGNAGSGKRADSKKPSIWKGLIGGRDPSKIGFNSITRKNLKTMNVGHLSSTADTLVKQSKATVSGGVVSVNMADLGVDKLLGAGKVARKLHVKVYCIVPGAKEKIEAAGGSVEADLVVDKEAVVAARAEKVAAEHAAKKKPVQQAAAKPKAEKAEE